MEFFARVNDYSSDTSTGFDSQAEVIVFPTEAERDQFVKDSNNARGRSVTAIDVDQARAIVKPDLDGKRMFKTPKGGYIGL